MKCSTLSIVLTQLYHEDKKIGIPICDLIGGKLRLSSHADGKPVFRLYHYDWRGELTEMAIPSYNRTFIQ